MPVRNGPVLVPAYARARPLPSGSDTPMRNGPILTDSRTLARMVFSPAVVVI